ncbi:MAG TPA: hypothetical protein VH575_33120 [Gemmataceae bacterium]|jgi:hypothetical protein
MLTCQDLVEQLRTARDALAVLMRMVQEVDDLPAEKLAEAYLSVRRLGWRVRAIARLVRPDESAPRRFKILDGVPDADGRED